jgi:hypothetical protein
VRVVLSDVPAAVSTVVLGDALDPRSWFVTTENAVPLLVLAVHQESAQVFDLYLLDKLGNALVTHTVGSLVLRAAAGGLIGSPNSATFLGCAYASPAASPLALVDIGNVLRSDTDVGGTLIVGSDGDYSSQSGGDFLNKLVIRRLTTELGAFFHLTSYGLGLRNKEPLGNSDLVRLRVSIETQLSREPEFSKVHVRLVLSTDNSMTIEVRAILRRSNTQVLIPVTALAF